MTNDDEMLAIEASYMEMTSKYMSSGVSPFAMAAVMVKLAMMIYKTSLNAEDYNTMIDAISDKRNDVRSLDDYDQLNRLN